LSKAATWWLLVPARPFAGLARLFSPVAAGGSVVCTAARRVAARLGDRQTDRLLGATRAVEIRY
jgi:hypothetical protein